MRIRKYGDEPTHLCLKDKALKMYCEITPLDIYEYETDDGYRYEINGAIVTNDLSEEDLLKTLEILWEMVR